MIIISIIRFKIHFDKILSKIFHLKKIKERYQLLENQIKICENSMHIQIKIILKKYFDC